VLTITTLTEILALVKEGLGFFCLFSLREKRHIHMKLHLVRNSSSKCRTEGNSPALPSQSSYLFPHQKTPALQCCSAFGNCGIFVYAVYA